MRNSRFGLVIFDCDGVLVDSEPIANRVFTAALNRIGLAIAYEEVCREFIGRSLAHCLTVVEERLGGALPADFAERLQEETFEAFRHGLRAVPGILEALKRIPDPVCVASSGKQEKMELTLGLTGLADRFHGCRFSATEVARGKPYPDLFLHAAKRMGVEPSACAVVEDSLPGASAARAAGMVCFGFAPHGRGDELLRAGARPFGSMHELPDLLQCAEGR